MSTLPVDDAVEPVIETDGRAIVLDLSIGTALFDDTVAHIDFAKLEERIRAAMSAAGTRFAYGRWGERRDLYRSEHFAGDDPDKRRDVHLGIDVFCAAGTPVRAPRPGRVHATANNARDLDYGPVVILEHDDGRGPYYTLYGHLSLDTLDGLEVGRELEAGESFARIGRPPENGNWPPHLHFQLILDLEDLGTEFPGVIRHADTHRWFRLCPLPAPFFPDVSASKLDGRS